MSFLAPARPRELLSLDEALAAFKGVGVYLFTMRGCPHCVGMKPLFEEAALLAPHVRAFVVPSTIVRELAQHVAVANDVMDAGYPYVTAASDGSGLGFPLRGLQVLDNGLVSPRTKRETLTKLGDIFRIAETQH